MNKKRKKHVPESAQAPGIDPEDSYGKKATKEDIKNNNTTMVTRLVYDEYDASDNES
ncbi:hypothetical protein [Oceanobacillus senegalensis]|uniref:hypothetical protein n=1 Tax=Oceanobacillus senegalensis TaxID=1936063 RepID=UPI0015C4B71D|nr:hypothetical protein [Oceanobacillus senegalensis]